MTYTAWLVIGDTAFIGTGVDDDGNTNDNFFRYYYKTKTWQYIGPIPGGVRANNVGFENNGLGFIAFDNSAPKTWQYQYSSNGPYFNPTTMNPDHYYNQGGIAFTIGNNSYLGLGSIASPYLNNNAIYIFNTTP
jgi:hypothetical protein